MDQRTAWTPGHIPSQTGRNVVVTGGSSGLGLAIATALARHGAHVVLAVRDAERGARAADQITVGTPTASVEVQLLDLSSLASVREAAREITTRHPTIDLLINNAGVMWTPLTRTSDGFELQMGTNHLAHFALTGLLMPQMLATADSRVVTISSNSHRGGRIAFEDLNSHHAYDRQAAYAQSKLANLLFTYELHRRLTSAGAHTSALAAHPGGASTGLTRNAPAHMRLLNTVLGPLLTHSAERGALPVLRAATDPAALGGEYYGPKGLGEMRGDPRRTDSHARSHDAEAQRRLWVLSEELTGVRYAL
ncbi:oxidoreductase [Streptomyces phaeochromogenes]|uniref:Oxidoreductase n=1 Tax=Streptomyces phaeochromogenes TaxID=1923 RepID=A0ABZ1H438_STRPH|nr:oxidoreductase [Streptomyces phaeochromogenes]MCX5602369.1 oxidoreductase [Streptomyces phaeochromogenes]WSD12423.1 oxidoreductase [Streptomyces phaeochromogenes]